MGSTLPEGLEAFLKAQKEYEAEKLKQLRQDIALGESQLDRGEGLPFDVNQIGAMGRERQKS